MTIEYILRHFSKVHTLCAIISSWGCIQKPYSDVVILICYSIYYSGQDAPQVFVHIKRIKLAKKNVKKMSTFSYEKTCLPSYAATQYIQQKNRETLHCAGKDIYAGAEFFFRQNVVVRVGLTRTTKFQAWLLGSTHHSDPAFSH